MKLNHIYHGDAVEVLKTFPDNSVDIVNTDPPYNLGKNYGAFKDRMDDVDYWNWMKEVFTECYRVMKDGYVYVSHSDKGIFNLKPLMEEIGYRYIQLLIWHGPNGYSMQKHRKTWSYRHEPILFFEKGNAENLIEEFTSETWYNSVMTVPRPQSNFKEGRHHPTQKPTKLYNILLARTPGSIVLDPFMGSGTTALAAINTSKSYVGIELNADFVKVAENRIIELTNTPKLIKHTADLQSNFRDA